jgi:hypothetical protein
MPPFAYPQRGSGTRFTSLGSASARELKQINNLAFGKALSGASGK